LKPNDSNSFHPQYQILNQNKNLPEQPPQADKAKVIDKMKEEEFNCTFSNKHTF